MPKCRGVITSYFRSENYASRVNIIDFQAKSSAEVGESTNPNQGIRVSAKTAVTFTLLSTLAIWLIPSVWSDSLQSSGIAVGTMIGMACGGLTCIKHFTLRLILYFNNYIPWNYARFLDYATERIFLQKVGGGYIFIHRLLMEHFAQMELKR